MSAAAAKEVVDLTNDEDPAEDVRAPQAFSQKLSVLSRETAGYSPSLAIQRPEHIFQNPCTVMQTQDKLQSLQQYPGAKRLQATPGQQQAQTSTHMGPTSGMHPVSESSCNPSRINHPALHVLDHPFMMDVLKVLIDSRPLKDKSPEQPVYVSLSLDYMLLLNQRQAVDQGRVLVFLEWLTVKMWRHGLFQGHESLASYALEKCQAAEVHAWPLQVCFICLHKWVSMQAIVTALLSPWLTFLHCLLHA